LKHEIQKLGRYDAIHVRNTDIESDYKSFFEKAISTAGPRMLSAQTTMLALNSPRAF
jgi:hypothetical protein